MRKRYSTHLECVMKYFSILNILNNLSLSKGDVNILSFCSIYGNISSASAKRDFIAAFGMASRSLDNSIRGLLNRGFLVKEGKKITLNKQLHIEFEELILRIDISNG